MLKERNVRMEKTLEKARKEINVSLWKEQRRYFETEPKIVER